MDSDAKPPKTLIRSVMDAFRGRTPEDGLDLDVDAEGQEPGLGRMLREDSPNEELVRAAAASETERSCLARALLCLFLVRYGVEWIGDTDVDPFSHRCSQRDSQHASYRGKRERGFI